jgi:hypothetical protein
MGIIKLIGIIILVFLGLCLYLLPWMIAYDRNLKNKDFILGLNILLCAFFLIKPISIGVLCGGSGWLLLDLWAYFDKRKIEKNANKSVSH